MTNKEFCARLRKAKKLAMKHGHYQWTILDACAAINLDLGIIAIFDEGGPYESRSVDWVYHEANSKDDIAAVFDNSIRNLGEEP